MRKLICFFIFILLFKILAAVNISDSLYFLNTDDNFRSLEREDFIDIIRSNEIGKAENNNVKILVSIFEEKQKFIHIFINNKEIGLLNEYGKGLSDHEFVLDLQDYINQGKNSILLSYREQGNPMENKKWFLEIGNINYDDFTGLPTKITSSEGWEKYLSISPDGRLIAYNVEGRNLSSVRIINLETLEEITVLESKIEKFKSLVNISQNKKFYSFKPCWSNNGEYLFFISSKSDNLEIWKARISYEGEKKDLTRLTNYQAIIYELTISANNDLFFISNKDGYNALYQVKNADKINNPVQFETQEKSFFRDPRFNCFSPATSFDGKYVAFCQQFDETKSFIIIQNIYDKGEKIRIESEIFDYIFPQWSPVDYSLAFYGSNDIFLYSMEKDIEKEPICFIKGIKKIEWQSRILWEPSGESIYYINDDKNSSIIKKTVSDSQEKIILDNKDWGENYELTISSNYKYLVFSGWETNPDLWLKKQNVNFDRTIADFKLPYNTYIELYSRLTEKFEAIGYYPDVKDVEGNIVLEKENLNVNIHNCKLNGREYSFRTFIDNLNTVQVNDLDDKREDFKTRLLMSGIPGYSQAKSNLHKKKNFFSYSLLGFAILGTGSYYMKEQLFNEYEKTTNIEDLYNYRNKYNSYSGLLNRFIIGGSLIYVLNIFDAFFSESDISRSHKMKHQEVFRTIKSRPPIQRDIYGKKLDGTGELKIITKYPYYSVSLIGENGEKKYYGKTNYILDKETYFTICDLNPGNYRIRLEKKFMIPYEEKVHITSNKITYKVIELPEHNMNKFKKFGLYSIPGYAQLSRNDKIKGYGIIGSTTISFIGSLIYHFKATGYYDDYKHANNSKDLFESRSSYNKSISLRNSFLLIFSLNYLYNLIDAYTGENL